MRTCAEPMSRWPLVTALLAIMTSLSVLGCSAGVSNAPSIDQKPAGLRPWHSSPSAGLSQRHSGSLLAGQWGATGTVLSAVNLANEPAGSVLRRPWAFKTICKSSWCRALSLRETLYGPSVTMLVAHHGYYTAAFPPVAVPCIGPQGVSRRRPGRLYDRYRLWWSANRRQLFAVQHQIGLGHCGPISRQTTRWTATRSYPTRAEPAPGV